ncbi:metal-dependent hydrolase [Glaciecola sp. 1036]|uniref:metal-dependent hydrolase n=1 Tax=Alteromonadaceae TaxID=72275 RepID=UPI003CFDBC51
MDSVTQVVLGGAVGYAVLGNKVGRKAAIYGAILGTLPDLDVFLDYGGPVENFTFHRSFSHSFLVQALISPLLAWLAVRIHPSSKQHFRAWLLMIFLTLSTHAILDSFTVYGTQLLWPLTDYPFGISSIFIIDPLYTLSLLIAMVIMCFPKVSPQRLTRVNTLALAISSLYLLWTLGAKWMIDNKIESALAERDIGNGNYVSTPAPFTTLLWRAVLVKEDQYYEIYASVFDKPEEVTIDSYQTSPELLNTLQEEWVVTRLQWFTKGLYSVKEQESNIVISDLRMGVEGSYVFNFKVAELSENAISAAKVEQISVRPAVSEMKAIWQRIWDPNVDMTPEGRKKYSSQ